MIIYHQHWQQGLASAHVVYWAAQPLLQDNMRTASTSGAPPVAASLEWIQRARRRKGR